MALQENQTVTPRQINQIRALLLAIFVGFPALILGFRLLVLPGRPTTLFVPIRASIAESGGFQPTSIQAVVGQKVILDFSSMDTLHSIAIGPGPGIDLGDIPPNQSKEVAITFERPGKYTYYCTRFCSVNHWRMRGVIEVHDTAGLIPEPQRDAVIEALITEGVDIDMQMEMQGTESYRPSLEHGTQKASRLNVPAELNDLNWRRTHTPQEAIERLGAANGLTPQADLADVAAFLWTNTASSDPVANGAQLYSMNCAYCHGETGDGDGLIAALTAKKPAMFSDAALMLNRRPDVLYAKIRRGGMGTDMPNFGTLFTAEETWELVDYLWTLTFQINTDKPD